MEENKHCGPGAGLEDEGSSLSVGIRKGDKGRRWKGGSYVCVGEGGELR